jgi:hypothetical protein
LFGLTELIEGVWRLLIAQIYGFVPGKRERTDFCRNFISISWQIAIFSSYAK